MAERAQTQIKPTAVPNLPTAGGTLQRKCACGTHTLGDKCDSCKGGAGPLQRKASGRTGYSEVPPIVHEALRSPGQPLDAGTRAFFGPRFDHDFSHVRVHTDSTAARSARAVNARAYTVGPDIVFGAGLYRPRNETGHRLLAHELVHVIQNRGSALTRMPLQGTSLSVRLTVYQKTFFILCPQSDIPSFHLFSVKPQRQNPAQKKKGWSLKTVIYAVCEP